MKITAVKTFLLRHSLPRPTGPSTYLYTSRQSLLIKLESDEGLSGWGETSSFGGVRSLIEQTYAPILIGQNPLEHRKLWRALWGPNFGNGIALGGVDIALHDLRGKALNQSIGDMYGGRLRDQVPAYASAMNYIQDVDSIEQYPDEAQAMRERGFRAMKMRIGARPMREDLAAVAAVRAAVGPDIKLMADGNGAYTLPGAVAMGRELEKLGLYWFEEPLPQNTPHYQGYDVLTDKLDIAIAAGEGLDSRGAFDTFINKRAADIVQPDVSLCGGIAETLFIAELARMRGLQCMPHCWAGAIVIAATVHVLSLLPVSSWARATETPMLELDMVENPFREVLLTQALDIQDGFVAVPSGPGLGIEVDEDMVRKYQVA